MSFKSNVTITFACVTTELLVSLMPAICIIYIFFFGDRINEMYSTLLMVPYFILITNLVLFIISLVARVFIRTKYYVNKQSLVVNTKNEVVEIKYDEVAGLSYDFGNLVKFNATPSQLVLFDKEYKQLLLIDNPSIIMVQMIKSKCKNIKISYYNNKRFLFLLLSVNIITVAVAILIKLCS